MSASGRKRIREEKPTDFEKVSLEFNALYNDVLAFVRDNDRKSAQERYLRMYNLYLKISGENLTKSQKKILDKRIKDASGMVPSQRKLADLKKTKRFK